MQPGPAPPAATTDAIHAPPRFPPRRRRLAGPARRRLRLQRRAHPRPDAAGRGRGRRRPRLPRAVADRLHLRRPVPAARPCSAAPSTPWSTSARPAPTLFSGVAVVGLPLAVDDQLFNCAAVLHRGRAARHRAQVVHPQLQGVLRGPLVRRRRHRPQPRGRRPRRRPSPSAPTASSPPTTSTG